MDAIQFYGDVGDRVLISVVKSGGHPSFDTEMLLIDPDEIDETNTQPGGDLLDHILLKGGLYTIVVQDVNLNHFGSYSITLLKYPDTLCPGIYNAIPSSICGQPTDLILDWEDVVDATGYDIFFGPDVIEGVPIVGYVTESQFQLTDLEYSKIYFWTVVAETPTGRIPGMVNWFGTRFIGDFDEDSDVDDSDLSVFAADFGRTDCETGDACEGDFDEDGDVDGSDLAVFAADFGRTDCP